MRTRRWLLLVVIAPSVAACALADRPRIPVDDIDAAWAALV